MKTDKVKVCIGIFIVFLLGAIAGVGGTKIYLDQKRGHGDHLSKRKYFWMEKLKSELNLTQQQQSEIQKILDRQFDEMREFREKHRPEMQEIIERGIAQMKEKLDDEQKVKLDTLHAKFMEERKRRHERGNG